VEAHGFRGREDLAAMKDVVRFGRAAAPRGGCWHPGELDWWFFYGADHRPHTTIWFDEAGPAGWVVVNEARRSGDSAVRPDLQGSALEAEQAAHLEVRLGAGPITMFAWGDDQRRGELLASLGFERSGPIFQTFTCSLEGASPPEVPPLPDGFRLLDTLDDEWVAERAECHRRAFDPSVMTHERYTAFRRDAPDYDPALDVAVVSDDGRVVAYAMAWVDAASGSGQLEPVGTRPHFWRRGLGQIANREALRRMSERGMRFGCVNTWAHNDGNIAFYESCGFERVTTVDAWVRA
jgi:ribosomal protein S18 acetylase RimI-like enzyme